MVAVLFLAVFWTCSTGLWSGAYGGGWIGVMRSSSRPGPWRPVNAFAWWDRALSGTTAILPASASCWSGSGARVVCQVFRFCSVGYGVTVLLVGGRASEKDWDVLCRSTDGLVRCPLLGAACGGSRPRARGGPRLPCRPSGPGPTGF